jgi:hypothetical protein
VWAAVEYPFSFRVIASGALVFGLSESEVARSLSKLRDPASIRAGAASPVAGDPLDDGPDGA